MGTYKVALSVYATGQDRTKAPRVYDWIRKVRVEIPEGTHPIEAARLGFQQIIQAWEKHVQQQNLPPLPDGFAYATTEELFKELGLPNAKHEAAVLDGIASGKVVQLGAAHRQNEGER